MPIGVSADGKHWVDPNHRCAQCGDPMPLPEKEGKFCPRCGKRQPTYQEFQASAVSRPEILGVKCPKCGAEKQNGNFCTECGTRLK